MNEWCIYIALYCVLLYTQSALQSCGRGGGSLCNHHQCAASTWMMRRTPQDNGSSALRRESHRANQVDHVPTNTLCTLVLQEEVLHNYTEYNQQWNVFSAFNPSTCTHTWSSGQLTLPRPGSSLGFGALLKGITSVVENPCRSRDSNPQPRVTSPTLHPLEPRLPLQESYTSLGLLTPLCWSWTLGVNSADGW